MTISDELARFTTSLDHDTIPESIVHSARLTLFNSYGIALGCLATPYSPIAREAALSAWGEQVEGATLLGSGYQTTISGAALSNAALFHGRAQEDTVGGAHLGVVLVPLLTALFEARRLPVERFIPSLVAGFEVGGRLEQVFAPRTSLKKFRPTTLYGTFAAAAAVAKALDLSEERTAAAISMAYSFIGGTLQSFGDGTDEWRYQPGMVANQGLVAAELAAAGATVSANAFEGIAGFGRVYAEVDEIDAQALLEPLGREWQLLRNAFKRYPVCAFNQALVSTCLELRNTMDATIDRVRVLMNPYELSLPGMMYDGPFESVGQTLMSVKFAAAATLTTGVPSFNMMNTFNDPRVLAMIEKIEVVPDESVLTLSARVEIERSGSWQESATETNTSNMNLTRSELEEVLARVADEAGVSRDLVLELGDTVFTLEHNKTLQPLIDLFARANNAENPR